MTTGVPPGEPPELSGRELFRPERLLACSDGVFVVAITLLVTDLRLPPIPRDAADPAMLGVIVAMGPKLFIFAFTFLLVDQSWLGHHRKLSYIRAVELPHPVRHWRHRHWR